MNKLKQLQLIHKEADDECFEDLKSCIVEDNQLKRWTIDKDTLLQNLPEYVVNEFLDFLGKFDPVLREINLRWIKKGTLIIHCDEEDD